MRLILLVLMMVLLMGCATAGENLSTGEGPTPANAAAKVASLMGEVWPEVDVQRTAELYRRDDRLGRIVDLNGDDTGELIARPSLYITRGGERKRGRGMTGAGPIRVLAWRAGRWRVVASMRGSYVRVLDSTTRGWRDLKHYRTTDGATRVFVHRYDGQRYRGQRVQVFQ